MEQLAISALANIRLKSTIVVKSKDRDPKQWKHSTYFSVSLPQEFKNISKIELVGGCIPNFIGKNLLDYNKEPFLYLNIKELKDNNVYITGITSPVFAKLHFDYNMSVNYIYLQTPRKGLMNTNINENISNLSSLTMQLLGSDGNPIVFGNDLLEIASFSATNPTTVTTTTNHGLSTGDKVYISYFKNGSTFNINNHINQSSGHVITVTSPNTFTIPVDLSSEGANQPNTGVEPPYPLGKYATILIGGNTYASGTTPGRMLKKPYTFSTTNPTVITTSSNHGLSTGAIVTISGFDNGTTKYINDLVNHRHKITVISPTQFSIPVDLSGQAANQQKTNTIAPYPLGQGSYAMIAHLQTSFDLMLTMSQSDSSTGYPYYN